MFPVILDSLLCSETVSYKIHYINSTFLMTELNYLTDTQIMKQNMLMYINTTGFSNVDSMYPSTLFIE